MIYGYVAEFDSPEKIIKAARETYEAGYRNIDAHTPFPLDELSEAVDAEKDTMAWNTLVGGIIGAGTGYYMQYFSQVVSYPWNIGGRPFHSWPAFVPVTFEMGVLGASLFAFFGLFITNRLPLLYHPVFNTPGFERSTVDRFYLVIESKDPKFNLETTKSFLEQRDALAVYEVEDES